MKCPGVHCPGCKGGGGAGFAIGGALALALIASEHRAIARGAGEIAHVIVMIAEVIALTAAGLAALALAAMVARVALWAHTRARARTRGIQRERAAVPLAAPVPLAGRVIPSRPLPGRQVAGELPPGRSAAPWLSGVPARAKARARLRAR